MLDVQERFSLEIPKPHMNYWYLINLRIIVFIMMLHSIINGFVRVCMKFIPKNICENLLHVILRYYIWLMKRGMDSLGRIGSLDYMHVAWENV
uniref:Transmembrane protein n=1 Tax=Lactuca sativa TaxID=4236 RepID=A0A9R1WIK7_LACSA|nr:hypothetical protein LSAT_V11C100048660 [Lactuca sativa]